MGNLLHKPLNFCDFIIRASDVVSYIIASYLTFEDLTYTEIALHKAIDTTIFQHIQSTVQCTEKTPLRIKSLNKFTSQGNSH